LGALVPDQRGREKQLRVRSEGVQVVTARTEGGKKTNSGEIREGIVKQQKIFLQIGGIRKGGKAHHNNRREKVVSVRKTVRANVSRAGNRKKKWDQGQRSAILWGKQECSRVCKSHLWDGKKILSGAGGTTRSQRLE